MIFALWFEADLPHRVPCRVAAGFVAAGVVVEDAEILMLRHHLAVALRERPRAPARLAWPDRAWLAILAGTLLAGWLAGMRRS
jgi:hypothetical protein